MSEVTELQVWLEFVSSLAWPAVTLAIAVVFRRQIQSLFKRVKSGEFAGAKLNFNEVATGFIASKVDAIAAEEDSADRALMAGEVKGIASVLGLVHPIALGLLLEGRSRHMWAANIYENHKTHFDQLEDLGLAEVVREVGLADVLTPALDEDSPLRNLDLQDLDLRLTTINLTQKGKALLRSIGLEDSDFETEEDVLTAQAADPPLQADTKRQRSRFG